MITDPSSVESLSGFVELVMTDRSFQVYRRDVLKLLKLLGETLRQSPIKPWYRENYDKLGNHCHYLVIKMSCDKRRRVVESRPDWLMVLAGWFDRPGFNNDNGKVSAFLSIAPEVSRLLKKFGPDSIPTMRPPPPDAQ